MPARSVSESLLPTSRAGGHFSRAKGGQFSRAPKLRETTAPLPAGLTWPNIIPGLTAESLSEGRMKLVVDHQLLTGGEVIDLVLYGEVAHRDPEKEKKLIHIRESEVAAGVEMAAVAVASKLGQLNQEAGPC